MAPFTKDEVYELNEWIRDKRGTLEDWIRDRKADRDFEEEIDGSDAGNQRVKRSCES